MEHIDEKLAKEVGETEAGDNVYIYHIPLTSSLLCFI